jgi:hypothetical protein
MMKLNWNFGLKHGKAIKTAYYKYLYSYHKNIYVYNKNIKIAQFTVWG